MKPIHTLEKPRVSIEFESISFLLENDCRNIVPRLVAAEEYYNTLVTLINRRSEIAYGEVQKRLEDAGLPIENSLAVNQFEAVVGPRLIVTIKGMTDSIYEMTDDLLNIMLVLAKELGAEAEKIFPKEIILKLSLDPDKETQK